MNSRRLNPLFAPIFSITMSGAASKGAMRSCHKPDGQVEYAAIRNGSAWHSASMSSFLPVSWPTQAAPRAYVALRRVDLQRSTFSCPPCTFFTHVHRRAARPAGTAAIIHCTATLPEGFNGPREARCFAIAFAKGYLIGCGQSVRVKTRWTDQYTQE